MFLASSASAWAAVVLDHTKVIYAPVTWNWLTMSCTLLVNHCVVAPVFSGVNRPALLHNFTAENSVVNLNWSSCASLTCIVGSGYLEDREKYLAPLRYFPVQLFPPTHTFSPYLYRGCVICNRYNWSVFKCLLQSVCCFFVLKLLKFSPSEGQPAQNFILDVVLSCLSLLRTGDQAW